jgi:hypothetical protein
MNAWCLSLTASAKAAARRRVLGALQIPMCTVVMGSMAMKNSRVMNAATLQ